jgi:hypothetical protein
MSSMDFLDRPWRSFMHYGRGGICHSRANGNRFDGGRLENQEQHGRHRRRARQEGHPALQSATCLFFRRCSAARDECAAHLLIGIDAPAALRTVSNMPLYISGFIVRKLAIHPSNQSF